MLDIGFSELLVFGIIGLLVLGPEKLPQALRSAARYYHKFKSTISNLQNDIDRELRVSELREQMKNEMDRIQALEQKMQAQMQQLQQQKIIEANSFLHSPNANLNNVILDTSALGFSKPVSMLNECKKITVLYSTIREFDKIQKSNC